MADKKYPVKEFIINDKRISVKAIAEIMYPKNKYANTYLSKKINEKDGQIWTAKDEQKAIAALKELHIDIGKVIEAK